MADVTDAASVTGTAAAPWSLRAYARHRGTSAVSVLRAIRKGRLKASLVHDAKGHAKIADPALADAEWAANTDLSRAPGYVRERADRRVAAHAPAEPASVDLTEPLSLTEASAREKAWKAKLAELDYRKKNGELVEVADIEARDRRLEARHVEVYQQCRTKVLAVPSKAKAALPHLSASDVRVIDALLREALEALAAEASMESVA